MDFLYGGAFRTGIPEAYERLILDALLGDATLFTRADEVEEQWSLVDAIVAFWKRDRPAFPNYEAGTWGPRGRGRADAPGRPVVATALSADLARSTGELARRRTRRSGHGRADPADERDDAHRLGADRSGSRRPRTCSPASPSATRRGRSCSSPTPTPRTGSRPTSRSTSFPTGQGRQVCVETIRAAALRLARRGRRRASSQPLLIPDLPVFLRWRGLPPFGERPFEELVDVVDRLIVDSHRVAGPARRRTRSWPRSSTASPSPTSPGRARAAGARSSPRCGRGSRT